MGWATAINLVHGGKEAWLDSRAARGKENDWLNALLSPHRLWAPKEEEDDVAFTRAGRNVTVRSTVEPAKVIYGEVMVSGFMVYTCLHDTDTSKLYYVIAYAHHQCEAFTEFKLDNTRIKASEWNTGTGVVSTAAFAPGGSSKLKIFQHLGTNAQTVDSTLTAASAIWDSTHTGKGVCHIVMEMVYDDTAWPTGAPENVYALIKGRRVYQAALDSTNGGSGSHRYTDATTWEWSDNAADCIRDMLTGGSICYDVATPNPKLLLGEDNSRIEDAYTIAAANICDESVTVPLPVLKGILRFTNGSPTVTGVDTEFTEVLANNYYIKAPDGSMYQISSITNNELLTLTSNYAGSTNLQAIAQWNTTSGTDTTQARYTCNVQLSLENDYRALLRVMNSACLGHTAYVEGKYRIFVGAYDTPSFTLGEDDIEGEVELYAGPNREDLYNNVPGTFFDEDRAWQLSSFPTQEDASYVADDGDLAPSELSQPATRNVYRAQRNARIHLRKSRNKQAYLFTSLSRRCLDIAEWDTFYATVPEHGFVSQVFRCLEWQFSPLGGPQIKAQIESASTYTDPAVSDYLLPRNVLPGGRSVMAPLAPTSLTTTSFPGYVRVTVLGPGATGGFPIGTMVRLYEYTANTPFSSATLIDSGVNKRVFTVPRRDTTTRYYWATAYLNGVESASFPVGNGTAGVADLSQTTDLQPAATTAVFTATDDGPDVTTKTAGDSEFVVMAYGVNSVSVTTGYKVEVSASFRVDFDQAGATLELRLVQVAGFAVDAASAKFLKSSAGVENGTLVATFEPTTGTYDYGFSAALEADPSNNTDFTFEDVVIRVTVIKR